MFDQLERKLGRFAVHNLTMYIVALTGAVYGLNYFYPALGLGNILSVKAGGGDYWNLFLYAFNIYPMSFIWALILLYMMWVFGTSLEEHMGSFRYNLFILLGVVFITGFSFFSRYPVGATYLEFSIFLAAAIIAPNTEILLFFILPLRMKWAALIAFAFLLYQNIRVVHASGDFFYLLTLVAGLGNLIVMFGPAALLGAKMRARSRVEKQKFAPPQDARHRCHVCGITEREAPQMDFRFCAKCTDHEYCDAHLYNHTHE